MSLTQRENLAIGGRLSADGGTDTIIELMLAEDYGRDGQDVKMTIHLEDYSGDIRLSDFVFI